MGRSATYRQGLSMGLTDLGGRLYRVNSDGSRDMFDNRGGQMGFWEDQQFASREVIEINGKKYNAPTPGVRTVFNAIDGVKDGKGESSWFDDHYYSEGSFAVTLGPQATAIPTPEGVVPAPYLKGGPLGININLGSLILVKGQADIKDGARITETFNDKKFTQGIGVALGNQSFDFNRVVGPKGSESVFSYVGFGGLFGVEYNFTKRELLVGMMPGAKWSLGIGIEGGIKQVLKFKY